ncbi:flagellar biosynthetic protein FliR, partial [Campylobacter jejuni]|uniref:flagellar biosynthetic protein FliR n=1 Tax=Campylobacter jejuni TaxID=197 RepID=UPI002F2696C1
KTMPQFNLLVIGYPIKIALGFVVLIAILLVMMQYFKNLILELAFSKYFCMIIP